MDNMARAFAAVASVCFFGGIMVLTGKDRHTA